MYLSRLILNPGSRQVHREIANSYQMHRTVMSAFSDKLSDDERVLFRLETHPHSREITLLVQSLYRPDWSSLQRSRYLLAPDPFDPIYNPAIKTFDPQLHPGQLCHFRLRANPTVKKKQDGKLQGRRVGLYREEKQMKWLARKARQNGFRIISAYLNDHGLQHGWISRGEKRQHLRMLVVQFDGVLQVINPELLRRSLAQGIGSAKAFGCGLLSLAPG